MLLAPSKNPLLLDQWIKDFIESNPQDCDRITYDSMDRRIIQQVCHSLASLAYETNSSAAKTVIHACLGIIFSHEFSLIKENQISSDTQPILKDITSILERGMLNHECSQLSTEQIESYPQNGAEYVRWLKEKISAHSSSIHSFYRDYLNEQADAEDIKFYLAQETNLDPRFDDILALLQIGTAPQTKMDIAKNYWDEMGNGCTESMHTSLFNTTLKTLNIDKEYITRNMMQDALVSGNISSSLATNKRHHYKAIGYFGVTEYTTPLRFKHVVKAWRRNNLPDSGIAYHELHIKIDALHGNSWFNNVIAPTVQENPTLGKEIAIGAFIRLNSSQRYLSAMHYYLQSRRLQNSTLLSENNIADTQQNLAEQNFLKA